MSLCRNAIPGSLVVWPGGRRGPTGGNSLVTKGQDCVCISDKDTRTLMQGCCHLLTPSSHLLSGLSLPLLSCTPSLTSASAPRKAAPVQITADLPIATPIGYSRPPVHLTQEQHLTRPTIPPDFLDTSVYRLPPAPRHAPSQYPLLVPHALQDLLKEQNLALKS